MMDANQTGINSLQRKDNPNTIDKQNNEKLFRFLKCLPHLEISAKGIKNISNRFNVAPEYLLQLVDNLKQEGGTNDKY